MDTFGSKIMILCLVLMPFMYSIRSNDTLFSATESKVAGSCATRNKPLAATVPATEERIVVKFNTKHNIVTADTLSGPSRLHLLLLQPKGSVDFRTQPSLRLRVVRNGTDTLLNRSVSSWMQEQKRKDKIAQINEVFENFEILEISLIDTSHKIDFVVDALMVVE